MSISKSSQVKFFLKVSVGILSSSHEQEFIVVEMKGDHAFVEAGVERKINTSVCR